MSPALLQAYIALLVCGVLLLGAETYVPGGILGAIGGLALFAAMIIGFNFGTLGGTVSAVGIILLAALVLWLWVRVFPKTAAGRRLTLSQDGRDFKLDDEALRATVGREGVALSPLRPSGIGEVDGRRCDVITRGEWMDAGQRFRVEAVEGARLIVAPIETAAPVETAAPGSAPS